jgi:LPXTG-site transpeptidase (sortase) family protein
MNEQQKKRASGRRWITPFAIALILVGLVAFATPLVLRQINYDLAAKTAAEAEAQMTIPDKSAYQPVNYDNMPQGVTPVYSSEEREEAGDAPGLLDELGILAKPSSLLFGIASAKAEDVPPASMREALLKGAQALEEAAKGTGGAAQAQAALAVARKQVENAFFLLTAIQPITDTEVLKSLENQQVVDGLTQGDKTITAARELIYATLTDLEKLLKRVEDLAAQAQDQAPSMIWLTAQMDTLSSYMRMAALHLPDDDYRSAMEQHRKLAALNPNGGEGLPDDESQYDPIDVDGNVKRSYLLEIPAIGVKVAAFRSGSFNKMYTNMHRGAAMFPRSPEPNTVGNISISAHRTGTRDYFRNLNKLSVGDTVYLHTSHLGSFQYEVVKVTIIDNNDWSVTSGVGYPALTLLSCQEYQGVSNAQRIMVRAKLVAAAPEE